ncbi:amino acid ABC transporter permease [Streptomyces pacificus]|uniref:Amino acid ABC transporter permease n=1 Tax=Streptomyces pacificus TaxID=2705029 RepID=A0A6A0AP58_9ACTN|nr:amino acid ABC transporter permease [Streptomyces pacificus]GFH34001.1 amino acid ABC transporter permease [Streptomyces pacificus]
MAWDEWERIKASAAERQSAEARLAPLPPDRDSGPSGEATGSRLKHMAQPWNRAAATAVILGAGTRRARADLTEGHTGVAGGLTGLSSLTSLTSALHSWESRLGRVEDECGSLETALRGAGRELVGVDHGVGTATNAVGVPQGGAAP